MLVAVPALRSASSVPKLTELGIKSAQPPDKGTYTLWDDSLKGFDLRVSQGGTKTFIVLIASGRRQKIGRYPTLSLAEARSEAKVVLAEKELGRIRPTHKSCSDAVDEFIDICDRKTNILQSQMLECLEAKDVTDK